jgi:hypothetical protein
LLDPRIVSLHDTLDELRVRRGGVSCFLASLYQGSRAIVSRQGDIEISCGGEPTVPTIQASSIARRLDLLLRVRVDHILVIG